MSYQVLSASCKHEYIVKKSQFIGVAQQANNREQALNAVKEVKSQYSDAGHNCWAYLIASPDKPTALAMNDDGEPSGTAGKPILNVLEHGQVGNIVVIINRYFGGIKLGAGGLVRAYSAATQQLMSVATTHVLVNKSYLDLCCDYQHEQIIRHFLSKANGEVLNVDYSDKANLYVSIPENHKLEFCRQIAGLSKYKNSMNPKK